MGGRTGRGAHNCKFCSGSFHSEFMLIMHFHKEHLVNPRKKGLLGKDEGAESGVVTFEDDFGSDEEDAELEVEKESEDKDDEDLTTMLNFLTDFERKLLRHPVFIPFSDTEEEDEFEGEDEVESEVNFDFEEFFQLEMKDLSETKQLKEKKDKASDSIVVRKSRPSAVLLKDISSTKSTSSRRKSLRSRTPNQLGFLPDQPKRTVRNRLPRIRFSEVYEATANRHHSKGIVTTLRNKQVRLAKAKDENGRRRTNPGKQEVRDSDLRRHHIRSHIKEKSFFCRLCDASFISAEHRLAHMEKQHPKRLPFKRRLCNQSYVTKSILKKHMLHHTVKKQRRPFGCKTCNRSYKHLQELTRHLSRRCTHAAVPISTSLRKLRCS